MRNLVKILVGLLVGVLVAPRVGIGAGIYLWACLLTVVLGVAVTIVLGAFLMLRAGRDVSLERIGIQTGIVSSLVVDRHLGFSLWAIIVLSVAALISRFCCDLVWPDMEAS